MIPGLLGIPESEALLVVVVVVEALMAAGFGILLLVLGLLLLLAFDFARVFDFRIRKEALFVLFTVLFKLLIAFLTLLGAVVFVTVLLLLPVLFTGRFTVGLEIIGDF